MVSSPTVSKVGHHLLKTLILKPLVGSEIQFPGQWKETKFKKWRIDLQQTWTLTEFLSSLVMICVIDGFSDSRSQGRVIDSLDVEVSPFSLLQAPSAQIDPTDMKNLAIW